MTKRKRKWVSDPNPVMFGNNGAPLAGPPITVDQVMDDPDWLLVFTVFIHSKSGAIFSAFPGAAPSEHLLSLLEELTDNYRNSLRKQ